MTQPAVSPFGDAFESTGEGRTLAPPPFQLVAETSQASGNHLGNGDEVAQLMHMRFDYPELDADIQGKMNPEEEVVAEERTPTEEDLYTRYRAADHLYTRSMGHFLPDDVDDFMNEFDPREVEPEHYAAQMERLDAMMPELEQACIRSRGYRSFQRDIEQVLSTRQGDDAELANELAPVLHFMGCTGGEVGLRIEDGLEIWDAVFDLDEDAGQIHAELQRFIHRIFMLIVPNTPTESLMDEEGALPDERIPLRDNQAMIGTDNVRNNNLAPALQQVEGVRPMYLTAWLWNSGRRYSRAANEGFLQEIVDNNVVVQVASDFFVGRLNDNPNIYGYFNPRNADYLGTADEIAFLKSNGYVWQNDRLRPGQAQ